MHDLTDSVEVAESRFGNGQQVQGADSGCFMRVGQITAFPDFAGMRHLTVYQANRAGEVE
jgi:hypothetical protein